MNRLPAFERGRGLIAGVGWLTLLIFALAFPQTTKAQVRSARQDSIIRVLTMHDASWQWLSYQSARFAVQEYGADAGIVAETILRNPATSVHPWWRLLGALGVAAYEQSGFPVPRLQELASGRQVVHRSANLNFGFRLAALRALSARPRDELGPYWMPLLRDAYPEVRRIAAAGLSCAKGAPALDTLLAVRSSDPDSTVRKVADFYVRQITTAGDSALLCHGGAWTRTQAASRNMPVDSALISRAERYFGFRRR